MARPERAPASPNVLRARQLLAGGAMGGHAAALIVIGVLYFVRGPSSLASSAQMASWGNAARSRSRVGSHGWS